MKIKTWNNQFIEIDLPDNIPGNLIALPALVDPHVHFRTPGAEHKENWLTGAQAAIAGGITTVFDMPNNQPSIINYQQLIIKKELINKQLSEINIPLNYHLYLGATSKNLREFEKCQNDIIGIKMFMSASTGTLLVDKFEDQERIFAECARLNLLLATHAVDCIPTTLELAKKFNTKLYICHVSTKKEVDLIQQYKKEGVEVYAEVTPHHLFLDETIIEKLDTRAKMIPSLKTKEDCDALWQGIADGTIDTIGTDHAPHTLEEKAVDYEKAPAGVPGIETSLPLLLNAYNEKKITLKKIVELTSANPQKIFNIKNNDWIIVDLDLEHEIKNGNLKTKCKWSPFAGWKLQGKPVATILNNKVFIIHTHGASVSSDNS